MAFRVEIDPADDNGAHGGAVYLFDGDEELVMWESTEWIEDPTVTLVIANAITIGFSEGPDAIRERLAHGVPT